MLEDTNFLSEVEIQQHHLQGLHYSESKDPKFHKDWKNLLLKNHLVASELIQLGEEFQAQSIQVTLLKGFSLLGDVYEDWGARFASDVDCLVSPDDLIPCIQLLEKNGFVKRDEETWLGNRFKVILIKQTPLVSVTMELHTKLYWHIDYTNFEKIDQDFFQGFKVLSREDQLIHLCGHLGFQHTFLKLFWLFDINRYLKKYKDSIHWEQFWVKADQYKLTDTCRLCLHLSGFEELLKGQGPGLKQIILRLLCSKKFLVSPRRHRIRYFLIKFLIKDRLYDNFKYVLAWLRFKNEMKRQSA